MRYVYWIQARRNGWYTRDTSPQLFGISCHFQKYKTKVCRTNGLKDTADYLLGPIWTTELPPMKVRGTSSHRHHYWGFFYSFLTHLGRFNNYKKITINCDQKIFYILSSFFLNKMADRVYFVNHFVAKNYISSGLTCCSYHCWYLMLKI